MTALIDMTGQKFGRWTVLRYQGDRTWACLCDCGIERGVNAGSLRSGRSTGCAKCNPGLGNRRTHGGRRTRLYGTWSGMKRRCGTPSDAAFPRYGGRGITVCPEWANSYAAFRDWALTNGYRQGLTIERRDNNLGYSPDNCRWATRAEQNRNYSRNRPVEYAGRVGLIGDFAAEHNMPADVVRNRVWRYGWTLEEALSTPVKSRQNREPWLAYGMSKSSYYRAKSRGAL